MDTILRYTFQPDYTVRACTELLYLKVKRSLYLAAKKATLMEFSQKDTNAVAGEFDAEVEKVSSILFISAYFFLIIFYLFNPALIFSVRLLNLSFYIFHYKPPLFQYLKDPEECLLLTNTQDLLNDEFKES